ncbi:MAG: hypothetical protein R6X02_16945 [Enhygromyxa sp.]
MYTKWTDDTASHQTSDLQASDLTRGPAAPRDEAEEPPRVVGRKIDRPGGALRGEALEALEALEEVEVLRAQVELLEAENQILAERAVNPGPERAYDFTQSELEALARNCDVRGDPPAPISAETAEMMGLREDEREAYERAFTTYKSQMIARQRELVIEAGAAAEEFDALDGIDQFLFVHETLGKNEEVERDVRRAIAEEKAGVREPPTNTDLLTQSPYARFYRFGLTEGDQFAAALAEELGPERVHELRAANAGWPGKPFRLAGCE